MRAHYQSWLHSSSGVPAFAIALGFLSPDSFGQTYDCLGPASCPSDLAWRDPNNPPPSPWYPVPANPGEWRDRTPSGVVNLMNGSWCADALGVTWAWWLNGNSGCSDVLIDERTIVLGTGQPPPGPTNPPNGRPDVFDFLIGWMDDLYGQGYRRLILRVPAGNPWDQDVPSSQWWPMSCWRREWFEVVSKNGQLGVKGWLLSKPDHVELALYVGWPINNPLSICMTSNEFVACAASGPPCGGGEGAFVWPCPFASPAHDPLTTSFDDMCVVWKNLDRWIDVGVTRVWLDASSGAASYTSDAFRWFAYNPDYRSRGVTFGGEAYPGTGGTITTCAVQPRWLYRWEEFGYAPWVMILSTAEEWYNNGDTCPPGDPCAHQWPNGSSAVMNGEAAIWPINTPSCGGGVPKAGWEPANRVDSMYMHYACKGFTIWGRSDEEYAERIFGFGYIANAADFNGDGQVTSADEIRFVQHYTNSQGYAGPGVLTFYHGDFNGDHIVNSSDWNEFYSRYWGIIGPGLFLGPVNWNMNSQWLPPCETWGTGTGD